MRLSGICVYKHEATSSYDVDGAYDGSSAFVADYTNQPSYTTGGTPNEIIVTRITASNANGSATPVYVAVKVQSIVEITFTVTNARVEVNGMVVPNGGKITVADGSSVSMKVTPADGMKVDSVQYGGTTLVGYSGVYDFTAVSGTTTVTITTSAS